jgi:hypothetical protein
MKSATNRLISAVALGLLLGGCASARAQGKGGDVRVVPNAAMRRVDVSIDGQPFTAYIFPGEFKKPVLYPLRTASGALVTRGFPLDPRPGERVDHPHHVGLWFSYGDVNGVDFWNNSAALPPAEQARMGTIVHRSIERAVSGKGKGELEVVMDWVMPDGMVALRERTQFVFHALGPNARAIDRVTTLTTSDTRVILADNKEGLIGLRVARALEHPSTTPEVFTDASGRPSAVPALDNTGVSGLYRSSEGKTGDDVWATRGRWVTLSGTVGQEPVTVAIFDHPGNAGHPTYWHARGYGLFAANPLGQRVFSEARKESVARELNLTLERGRSVTFRHRLLILSGAPATPDEVEEHYRRFVAEVR